MEWKKCSSCKNSINVNSKYYVCSVSTCTSKRTGLVFCSISCWERHLPIARHRDAGAIEKKAPSQPESTESNPNSSASGGSTSLESRGTRRIISSRPQSTGTGLSPAQRPSGTVVTNDILIVASKLKNYIKAVSDMNTSGGVMDVLSNKVRRLCDQAIDEARKDGRKTVLDRDFK